MSLSYTSRVYPSVLTVLIYQDNLECYLAKYRGMSGYIRVIKCDEPPVYHHNPFYKLSSYRTNFSKGCVGLKYPSIEYVMSGQVPIKYQESVIKKLPFKNGMDMLTFLKNYDTSFCTIFSKIWLYNNISLDELKNISNNFFVSNKITLVRLGRYFTNYHQIKDIVSFFSKSGSNQISDLNMGKSKIDAIKFLNNLSQISIGNNYGKILCNFSKPHNNLINRVNIKNTHDSVSIVSLFDQMKINGITHLKMYESQLEIIDKLPIIKNLRIVIDCFKKLFDTIFPQSIQVIDFEMNGCPYLTNKSNKFIIPTSVERIILPYFLWTNCQIVGIAKQEIYLEWYNDSVPSLAPHILKKLSDSLKNLINIDVIYLCNKNFYNPPDVKNYKILSSYLVGHPKNKTINNNRFTVVKLIKLQL